jgi:hemolysin III
LTNGRSDSTELAQKVRAYTLGEEIANSIIHGVGVGLSIAALAILLVFAAQNGSGWAIAGSLVFGISLILEYTASTLYHSFPQPQVKHIFKILDHAGIYVLIAGTYTPFCLVTLRDRGGFWLFAIIWALALAGISAEAFWVYRPRWLNTVIYVAMGWIIAFEFKPLAAALDSAGMGLLLAGGFAYTFGTVFYLLKRVRYMHGVWHLCVLAGSILHFLAVLIHVVIPAT